MLRRFWHFLKGDRRGSASVELAMISPMLISLLLGMTELTRYILINDKSQTVAATVGNLVTQEQASQLWSGSTFQTSAVDNLLLAASQVMTPYTFGANGVVIVSSVTQTGTASPGNQPKIDWQVSGGGTYSATSRIGSVGNNANMPVEFTMSSGDNVIITEVFYNYTTLFGSYNNTLGKNVLGGQVLYKTAYYKPRLGALGSAPAS